MRECPFCGFDEGWTKEINGRFRVVCNVCGAMGPESNTYDGAKKQWNGALKQSLEEDVSAPMSTVTNTPGIGNAQPGTSNTNFIGSGDNWGNSNKKKKKIYKKKTTNEEQISPYDKIGVMMANKMKVPLTFKKSKNQKEQHIKQIIPKSERYKVTSYEEFANQIKEGKNPNIYK